MQEALRMDQGIKIDLSNCKTVSEAFKVLEKYYKLEEATLSDLYKNLLIINLEQLVKILKIQTR